MNNYNRRLFLRNTGLIASGIALAGIGCASPANKEGQTGDSTMSASDTTTSKAAEHALAQFGLQLYTLRDDLPKDPKKVLQMVAGFGYKQVEGYEGEKGLWWGMQHKEFKNYLDEIGLTMVSSHCDTTKNFERKAAEAAENGLKYLIKPWLGPQKTLDDYKKAADDFNRLGDVCKKNGIKFAYHNHGYSFKQLNGEYPQDILMQNTNADTIDYEMDIYWVVTPGEDPIKWLEKYPNRFRLCHIKDRMKNVAADEENASADLGTGTIDFKSILKVAEEKGMQYYIVEQERYDNTTPLKSVEANANYMKTFTL